MGYLSSLITITPRAVSSKEMKREKKSWWIKNYKRKKLKVYKKQKKKNKIN